MVALHWWELASLTGISANIFSFTSWRETSIVGCSSANSNVCANFLESPSHSLVPCRNSIDVYQVLGFISNVCMKWCTHSCLEYYANTMQHWLRFSMGFAKPEYLWFTRVTSSLNMTSINIMHCGQFVIDFLCAPHHLASVDFTTWSSVDKC